LSTAKRPNISPQEIAKIFGYSAQKNCMATSNRLFGNVSTIYMATAQKPIFWLLRIHHLATAHHPIIYLLQIDQLFHHWNSSIYFISEHGTIV